MTILNEMKSYTISLIRKKLLIKTGQFEKITTLRETLKLINKDSKIFDIGAGTGVYSIPLADEVSEVVAFEPASNNYKQVVAKVKDKNLKNIIVENKSSLQMDNLSNKYFDVVLIFGPMYHLSSEKDRSETLKQAKRVVKDDGYILISYINHDIAPMTKTKLNCNFFESNTYISDKQRLINKPFISFTLAECIEMIEKENLSIIRKIGSSGFSEILGKSIDDMSDVSYQRYLDWHLSHCDKEELLGASNHYLFICKK